MPPFPWRERRTPFARERDSSLHGFFPMSTQTARRAEALEAQQADPTATYTFFKRNQLVFASKRSASPFSVATDPHHHRLARDLLGPAVIDWLVRHWASRSTAWQLERWTDAPLHAALHAAYSDDYGFIPSVLDELEENLEANLDLREDGAEKYGERVRTPPGRSRTERLAESFDVAFADVIDLAGYFLNDLETPLPHLGVVVLSKRLGLLADFDPDHFDPERFATRFREALGVPEGADHATWRDAALRTIPDEVAPIDALPTYGASAIHADAVLHAYLLDRTARPAVRTLIGLLGRGRAIAWPDRWALQRFVGIPVNSDLAELRGTTRGGFDLGNVPSHLWPQVNALLTGLAPFETMPSLHGPFYERDGRWRAPRGAFALDGALVQEGVRLVEAAGATADASRALVAWLRERARSKPNEH